MATYTKVGVGYNIQIAVDAKHKMIVEQAVSEGCCRTWGFCKHGGAGAGEFSTSKKSTWPPTRLFQERGHLFLRGSRPDTIRAGARHAGRRVKKVFSARTKFRYDAARNAMFVLRGRN